MQHLIYWIYYETTNILEKLFLRTDKTSKASICFQKTLVFVEKDFYILWKITMSIDGFGGMHL